MESLDDRSNGLSAGAACGAALSHPSTEEAARQFEHRMSANVIGDGKKVIAGHFPVIGDGRLTFASLPMAMIPVAGPSANAMNV